MALIILSCERGGQIADRPDDLISSTEIIPLIIDLQVLESHYQRTYQRPNLYKTALESASLIVFEKHHTSKEQFERSYKYYAMDVTTMYMIYEAALDSINLRVTEGQLVE